jgi:methionine-gamma-lyase
VLEHARAKGRVSLIYIESPANPTNVLVDVEAVAAARDALFGEQRPPIAIDNTFLGRSGPSRSNMAPTSPSTRSPNMRAGHSDLVAGAWSAPRR